MVNTLNDCATGVTLPDGGREAAGWYLAVVTAGMTSVLNPNRWLRTT